METQIQEINRQIMFNPKEVRSYQIKQRNQSKNYKTQLQKPKLFTLMRDFSGIFARRSRCSTKSTLYSRMQRFWDPYIGLEIVGYLGYICMFKK